MLLKNIRLFGLSVFLLFIGAVTARTGLIRYSDMSKEEVIIALCYEKMYRYMIAKDTAALGDLLGDEFVLVHMTGMRQAKREYLYCIANGTLNYFSCKETQLDISVNGNTARMTGRSRVNAAVFGGRQHTWPLQLDINLSKRNGQWLFTGARARFIDTI